MYEILHYERLLSCSQDNRMLHHDEPPLACNIVLRYRGPSTHYYLYPINEDRSTPSTSCTIDKFGGGILSIFNPTVITIEPQTIHGTEKL